MTHRSAIGARQQSNGRQPHIGRACAQRQKPGGGGGLSPRGRLQIQRRLGNVEADGAGYLAAPGPRTGKILWPHFRKGAGYERPTCPGGLDPALTREFFVGRQDGIAVDEEGTGEGPGAGKAHARAQPSAADLVRDRPGDLLKQRGVGSPVEGERETPFLSWSGQIVKTGSFDQTIIPASSQRGSPWESLVSTAFLTPTERTTLHRRPTRGSYDVATVHAILDEALICHVGFAVEGQPYVLPTTHARVGDQLYIHGAVGGRFLKSVKNGIPVCVTVTLIDALVLARSAFHHSMNYRSVVVLGTATEVTDPVHKRRAFDALIEHVVRGRSAQIRGANEQELKATSVLAVPIVEASAKIRTGPPIDDEEDYAVPCWAGLIPVSLKAGAAVADPKLAPGIVVPPEVGAYKR
jgi:uncharacterized protein